MIGRNSVLPTLLFRIKTSLLFKLPLLLLPKLINHRVILCLFGQFGKASRRPGLPSCTSKLHLAFAGHTMRGFEVMLRGQGRVGAGGGAAGEAADVGFATQRVFGVWVLR